MKLVTPLTELKSIRDYLSTLTIIPITSCYQAELNPLAAGMIPFLLYFVHCVLTGDRN